MQLYIFSADAFAQGHSGFADGARHALNVFVRAPTIEVAGPVARARLAAAGWTRITLHDSNAVRDEIETIDDPTMRAAAASALQHGFAIVEYGTPME
jgi:hypothetical protein